MIKTQLRLFEDGVYIPWSRPISTEEVGIFIKRKMRGVTGYVVYFNYQGTNIPHKVFANYRRARDHFINISVFGIELHKSTKEDFIKFWTSRLK